VRIAQKGHIFVFLHVHGAVKITLHPSVNVMAAHGASSRKKQTQTKGAISGLAKIVTCLSGRIKISSISTKNNLYLQRTKQNKNKKKKKKK
jgi:hypothetical protein